MSIANRLKEPSTYAGLAATVAGVGQIFGDVHTDAIAGAITQAAPSLIAGNWLGALMSLFGLAAIFMKEKK
mgnify:CR=1 FL=1